MNFLFTKSPQLFKDTINLDAYIKSSLGLLQLLFDNFDTLEVSYVSDSSTAFKQFEHVCLLS